MLIYHQRERGVTDLKTNNTLSKQSFIIYHIIWTIISFLWYKNIIFRCIDKYSLAQSKVIFWCIIVASCLFGIILEIKNSRNRFNVLLNIVFGFGLYTVHAYIQIRTTLIMITLFVAAVLSIGFGIYIICRKIKNKMNSKRIIKKRLVRSLSLTRQILSLGFALIICCSAVSPFFDSTIINASAKPATQSNLSEQSLANNIETIKLLQDDLWKELSVKEKLNVLQTVANIEQRYLGLPNELNVGAANLREGVSAEYKDDTHQVTINLDSLLNSSSWELLNSVCHEAYHCYEHRLVDVYSSSNEENRNLRIFHHADSYTEEFSNYISGSAEDFYSYYNQVCEKDARNYAEEAVVDYQQRIMEYINSKDDYSG